jgi:hypothetical protein
MADGKQRSAAGSCCDGSLADEVVLWIDKQLELMLALKEAVLGDQFYGLDHRGAAGLVLVEQVTGEKDEVDIVLDCQLQNLFKRPKGIILAYFILLPDALQNDAAPM